MPKKKSETKQDLSSFMAILIMTIGALVVLLISNTMIIISNPENTTVTSVVTTSLFIDDQAVDGNQPFPMGNELKEPRYIDVHRDRIIMYPGSILLPVRELGQPNNALERFLEEIHMARDQEYVVLLVRPYSAEVYRRIAKAVRDRQIDLGIELFEAGRAVDYEARRAAATREF